jgi:hypothetical protein
MDFKKLVGSFGGLKKKVNVNDLKDKVDDVAQIVDDKAETLDDKGGMVGGAAKAVHQVADKLDKD